MRRGFKGRIVAAVTAVAVCFLAVTVNTEYTGAATRMPENIKVSVDGQASGTVRAINAQYDDNLYISLRDTAVLLAGSMHPVNLDINGGSANIIEGESYADELDHTGWKEDQLAQQPGGDPGNAALLVNGEERRY